MRINKFYNTLRKIVLLLIIMVFIFGCQDRIVTDPDYVVYELRRPNVTHHVPLNDAEDVIENVEIELWFDELMQTSSVETNFLAYRVIIADTIKAVGVDPINSEIVYAAKKDGGIFKSTDGGNSWLWISRDFPRRNITNIQISSVNPNIIYILSDEGIFKSINGAESWTNISTNIYTAIVLSRIDENLIYVASADEGVIKSSDGGASWSIKNGGLRLGRPLTDIELGYFDESVLFVTSIGDYIYQSLDGADNWVRVRTGLSSRDFNSISVSPIDSNYVCATSPDGNIYLSKDNGESWTNIKSNLPSESVVNSLDFSPVNSQTIILATNIGPFISSDDGSNWSSTIPSYSYDGEIIEPSSIADIKFSQSLPGTIFSCGINGIFKSEDNGKSFIYKNTVSKDNLTLSGDFIFTEWSGEQVVISNINSEEIDTSAISPYVIERALTLWEANGRIGDPPVPAYPSATKLTFISSETLESDWKYKVRVKGTFEDDENTYQGERGAEDINGNSFESDYSFSFTTRKNN